MRDRDTGRSRGFGFVTYGSQQDTEAAIDGLHDQELDGRYVSKFYVLQEFIGGWFVLF
jgi:cold-inducible RNA-binding protein